MPKLFFLLSLVLSLPALAWRSLPDNRDVLSVGSDYVVLKEKSTGATEIFSTKTAARQKIEFVDEKAFVKASFSHDEGLLLLEHFDVDVSFFRILDLKEKKVVSGLNDGTRDLISIGWEDNCKYHLVRWHKKEGAEGEKGIFAVDRKEVSRRVLATRSSSCESKRSTGLSHAFQTSSGGVYVVRASGRVDTIEELGPKIYSGLQVSGPNELWFSGISKDNKKASLNVLNLNTRQVSTRVEGITGFAVSSAEQKLFVIKDKKLFSANTNEKKPELLFIEDAPFGVEAVWVSAKGDTLVLRNSKQQLFVKKI